MVGTFWSDVATIGYLEVGGVKVDHILTRTVDDGVLPPPAGIGADTFFGVLPSGYLRHFMTTIDFGKKKARFDAKKDDSMQEPTVVYTLGISLEETTGSPVHVTATLPGSSAAADGIQPGDEIVNIEGAAVANMDPYSRAFALSSGSDATTIHVDVSHAGTTTTHALVTHDLLTSPQL
jgi:membrane-associated protease RseP (regulator of RpoE activity)